MAETELAPTSSCMPKPGVKYPIKVDYCPNCSMPFEYCEYYPDYEGCKKWLEQNMPERFASLGLDGGNPEDGEEEEEGKKRQTREEDIHKSFNP